MSRSAPDSLMLSDDALLRECDVDTYRSHGPGGQKRNKTDSAVRLRHRPTGLVAIGVESRSQHENKARALRRLRHLLALHVRQRMDLSEYRPTPLLLRYVIPGRSGQSRSASSSADTTLSTVSNPDSAQPRPIPAGSSLRIRPSNPDYCVVLREVLDVLCASDLRVDAAARTLGLTTSQLVRFLRSDDHAWAWVQQQRSEAGLKPLR